MTSGADPLRVLHVAPTLGAAYGGPTAVVQGLASAQVEAGLSVAVWSTDLDYPPVQPLPTDYVSKLFPPAVDVKLFPVAWKPLLYSPALAGALRREVASFDVVHVHGLYRFPSTSAAMAAGRRGVPYLVTPHGTLDPYLHDKSTTGHLLVKRVYEKLFVLPSLRQADAIHRTAEAEREVAGHLGLATPSFVVPNGVPWERYRQLPARGRLRAQWGVREAPVVLFLRRLHFKKGLDLLVEAFDVARIRLPLARLRARIRPRGRGS